MQPSCHLCDGAKQKSHGEQAYSNRAAACTYAAEAVQQRRGKAPPQDNTAVCAGARNPWGLQTRLDPLICTSATTSWLDLMHLWGAAQGRPAGLPCEPQAVEVDGEGGGRSIICCRHCTRSDEGQGPTEAAVLDAEAGQGWEGFRGQVRHGPCHSAAWLSNVCHSSVLPDGAPDLGGFGAACWSLLPAQAPGMALS